jgi:activator of HSP90 ATPase
MRRWRTFVVSIALFVSPIVLAQSAKTNEAAASPAEDHSKSIHLHQEIDFSASPQWLYEALLDSKKFSAFSTRVAEIKREPGGAFSLFAGHIVGRNLELVSNRRIVQAWRVVDWPEGVYSVVRFELKAQSHGTRLIFDHIGFPVGLHDHLAEGWESNYWSLLKKVQ